MLTVLTPVFPTRRSSGLYGGNGDTNQRWQPTCQGCDWFGITVSRFYVSLCDQMGGIGSREQQLTRAYHLVVRVEQVRLGEHAEARERDHEVQVVTEGEEFDQLIVQL